MENSPLNIVIVGGGSTYTPGIVRAMLSHQNEFPIGKLTLYDNNPSRNEDMYLIIQFMLKKEGLADTIELVQTENPKTAFVGADFIFSQIRVGGLEMREKDEKIPLKYGMVGQETCGLGGFAYGLRSIHDFLEILGFIQEYAPQAWTLNYTNPETIMSEAAKRAYPDMKLINACDMTISLEETIAVNFGYDRKNWIPTYYGLNHYGWYSQIYDKSLKRDVMPEIIERLQTHGLQVADFNAGDKTWQEAWDLLRHMVQNFPEYLPNNYLSYYLYPDVNVEHSDPNHTRANIVMEGREKNTRRMAEMIRSNPDDESEVLNFNFGEHGNYIVEMATSILHDKNQRFMLIVQNNGAIPNLRPDAMVEIPAYVNARGVDPVALGFEINNFHKGLMEAQNAAEKLLVDAYFEKSYSKALQAFTLNQTIPNATVAKQILDEFIEANKGYWPELN